MGLASLALLNSGCVARKLDQRLAAQRENTIRQTQEISANIVGDQDLQLDWNSAVKLLAEQNTNLLQGRNRIDQARKTRDDQWKSWLPRVGIYANLQSSLAGLGDLSFSDLNASVVAPLTIPNPLTEEARAFQNALAYLEASDSYQLTYRRQVASLYRLFAQYERQLASGERKSGDSNANPSVTNALQALEQQAAQQENLKYTQATLAQLLNLPGRNPVPLPSTRPRLDYERRVNSFVPGKNYGQLAVRLSAYQIEGALLREKGIKLNRLPSISLNTTTPALYDSRNSSNSSVDADNIYLFGGLTDSYDFTGREAESVRTAEQNTEFVKQNLKLRLDQESRQWIRLKERYKQLNVKRSLVEDRIESIRRKKSGGSVEAELDALRSSRTELDSLTQAKENLDLEVWIWDEDQWKRS